MNKGAMLCFVFTIIAILTSGQASHPTPPRAKSSATSATVSPRATWDSNWQQFGGVSVEQFHEFGYDGLSKDQGKAIFSWILMNQPSLVCGKMYPPSEKEDLKYVHPFIHAANDEVATFVGQLRSRIGTTQDVKLAYADADSDLIVDVMALTVKDTGGRPNGFVARVNVLTPCTYIVPSGWNRGTSTFNKMTDSFVQVGPDEAAVLSHVASTLDVDDFDPIRTEHLQIKKSY